MSQKKSGGVVSNAFANSIIKERILEDGRVELEVFSFFIFQFNFVGKTGNA